MEAIDLAGRKGLVVGIANEHSLAWAAAQHFRNAGAELGITYRNDKAKPFVEPLARKVDAAFILPCNVALPEQVDGLFAAIREKWGRLDFLFHAVAWHARTRLLAGLPTVRPSALRKPWSFHAIRLSEWHSSPSR